MSEREGLGIEVLRDGRYVIADMASIKDGETFRMFGRRRKYEPRIAMGDAYLTDSGNWSVSLRPK